jgi:hypothetical protein
MDVIVHNQYSDIELSSPLYFCKTYNGYSVERTDFNSTVKIGFRFDVAQDRPGGILMYKVQREATARSYHQSNIDIAFTEVAKHTYKMMRLLVAWEVDQSGELWAGIVLVEHDNMLVLNRDNLAQLYGKVNAIPSKMYGWICRYDSIYKSKWLLCDNTVLEVTYKIIYEKGCELKIAISKGVEDKYTMKPLWIDSKRQVSTRLMIFYINLMLLVFFFTMCSLYLLVIGVQISS